MKKSFTFLIILFLVNNVFSQLTLKVQVESIQVLGNVDCDAGLSDNSDFVFEFKATDNTPFANTNVLSSKSYTFLALSIRILKIRI